MPQTCRVLQSNSRLKDWIDDFIEKKILMAAKAISNDACKKICDGDVILIYSRSVHLYQFNTAPATEWNLRQHSWNSNDLIANIDM